MVVNSYKFKISCFVVKKVNTNSAKTSVVKGRDTLKTSSCQNLCQQYSFHVLHAFILPKDC